jgi:hypothetical protein
MHVEEPEEPYHPELQLEYAGGGSGSRPRIALGYDEFGKPIDRSGLPGVPFLFLLFAIWEANKLRKQFEDYSPEKSMCILQHAGVPPLYRLGLGLQWGFIHPIRQNFTIEDFSCLIEIDCDNLFGRYMETEKVLREIELRSAYHLFLKYGFNFARDLEDQNSVRFAEEWGVSKSD